MSPYFIVALTCTFLWAIDWVLFSNSYWTFKCLFFFFRIVHIVLFFVLYLIYFWPHHRACKILVPWPGIEPTAPVLETQSLNHWTAREVPILFKDVRYPSSPWSSASKSLLFESRGTGRTQSHQNQSGPRCPAGLNRPEKWEFPGCPKGSVGPRVLKPPTLPSPARRTGWFRSLSWVPSPAVVKMWSLLFK